MVAKVRRNPRVNVTLSPEANDLIGTIAKLSRQSKSSIVAEFIDIALPAMQQIWEALKVVNDAPLEAQRIMSRFAAQATGELAQAQLDLDAAVDARTVKGRRAKRAKNATA